MNKFTDEEIMSYLDSALDEAARVAVAQRLKDDPETQKLVDQMRRSEVLLRETFDPTLREAVPQNLIDTVMGSEPLASNVVSLQSAQHKRRWSTYSMAGVAIAASALFATAAVLIVELNNRPGSAQRGPALALGPMPTGDVVANLLETLPSGKPTAFELSGQKSKLMVLSTFRDGRALPCREFELSVPGQGLADEIAIACRAKTGGWSVVGAAELGKPAKMDSTEFLPASDPSVDPLGKVFDAIGAKPQLTPDEEQALIKGKWQ